MNILQLHEKERKTVHEANDVCSAAIEGTFDPKFTHTQEVVFSGLSKSKTRNRARLAPALIAVWHILLFRRDTDIATGRKAPIVLFKFGMWDKLDEAFYVPQFGLWEALLKPTRMSIEIAYELELLDRRLSRLIKGLPRILYFSTRPVSVFLSPEFFLSQTDST